MLDTAALIARIHADTKRFAIYEIESGRIRSFYDGIDGELSLMTPDGLAGIEVARDIRQDIHWIDGGSVALRPSLAFDRTEILADDVDAARLTLDRPFTATVDGTRYDIDEPTEAGIYELAITSPMPADYPVEIDVWPYLPLSTRIIAR